MKKLDHLSRAELEAEIQRLKSQSDFKRAKGEIAALRANLAEWLWNQTEVKPPAQKLPYEHRDVYGTALR